MINSIRYDDRVDTQTELGFGQTLGLIRQSLGLLTEVKKLFVIKCGFALGSLLPALAVPWLLKIVVDQVILQQPFDTGSIPFPPFMMPLVGALDGMSPTSIMATLLAVGLVMMVTMGLRGAPAEQVQFNAAAPQGFDPATQSEAALSSGGSATNGLWGLAETMLTIRMTQRLANDLRTRLMGRLSRLEMTTLDDQRVGDSIYRVMYDAPMLPEICYRLTIAPSLLILSTGLSIYLMGYSYGQAAPELIWVAACVVPAILLVTAPLSRIARRLHQASRAAGSSTTNSIEESIDNIRAVQSLGGGESDAQNFDDKSAESFRRHRHTVLLDAVAQVASYLCATAATVLAFILITDEVIAGVLSPGDYAALWGLFMTLQDSGRQLGLYWIDLQRNVAAVRRVFFFIDHTSEVDREVSPMKPVTGSVVLENVGFKYPDGRRALENISVELPLGELVAIVGPTGAGKTTLAYLIPGYIRPTEGSVRFDQQDLAESHVDDIRGEVSFVFQEHMLLSVSIRDNLLLANPHATEDEMLEACRRAGAMEFIDCLPGGIDTVVGKGGDTLSVGQKQRLSIARGLVRNTPIIVLDEPTAALDPPTENALMASLRGAVSGRLVVVIAHRLSTIRRADRIIFLEEGRVLDVGSHDVLMTKHGGRYRQFVEMQNA